MAPDGALSAEAFVSVNYPKTCSPCGVALQGLNTLTETNQIRSLPWRQRGPSPLRKQRGQDPLLAIFCFYYSESQCEPLTPALPVPSCPLFLLFPAEPANPLREPLTTADKSGSCATPHATLRNYLSGDRAANGGRGSGPGRTW